MKAKISTLAAITFSVFLGISAFIIFNRASAGTLTCTVTSTCVSPAVGVLYLASTTNSHAALASSSGYANIVCCSGVGSLGNTCSGVGATSTFLHLASSTNSHSEENTQNNYPTSSYACLSVGTGGTVAVGYVTTTTCQAAGYDTALVSMASSTNSHVASPGSSTFQAGSTIQVCASASTPPPAISNVLLNGGSSITLTPNATTSINLTYTVTDFSANGCSDIFTSGSVTSTAFIDTVSSTCESNPTGNNLNCYVSTLAGTTNSCGGLTTASANATDTLNIYYYARSTGVPSSTYPNDHWYGYVGVSTQGGVTSTATSSAVDVNVLSALAISSTSINFGSVLPNTNTGGVNQMVTVSNAGNTSNTPELSGTVFVHSGNSFATSSEHYASSSFTFGGSEQQMNTAPTVIPGVVLTAPTSTPSSSTYSYTRSITVTSTTSIASGTNTNFPMLFSGTYSWLEPVSNGGRIQHLVTAPNGGQEPADLVFSSASSCSSPLNFETESYTSSTGAINDWVNVSSLSAGSVIYACYGATSITTDQSHPSATWSSNYGAVWHFPTSLGLNDSTANGNTLANAGAVAATGQIGGAASISASTQMSATSTASINVSASNFTISTWTKTTSTAGFTTLYDKSNGGGLSDYSLFMNAGVLSYYRLANDGGGSLSGTHILNDGNWHYVVWSRSGNNNFFYVDSVFDTSVSDPTIATTTGTLSLGQNLSGGGNHYSGQYDEFRILNVALTPSWIVTEYNNQNSPSTFYSVGSETANNGGGANIYFGLQVPFAVPSGTYNATDTFTGLFSN